MSMNNTHRLLINRIPFSFIKPPHIFLLAKITDDFVLNKNKASWIRENLSGTNKELFVKWMDKHEVEEEEQVATEFLLEPPENGDQDKLFSVELDNESCTPFKRIIFIQELGKHLQQKELYIDYMVIIANFSAYQFDKKFNDEYDQFRRIDFKWQSNRSELILNFGSERTLIENTPRKFEDDRSALCLESFLVYKNNRDTDIKVKNFCSQDIRKQYLSKPQKFSYKERYEKLKKFAEEYLYDLNSPLFSIDRTGFMNVAQHDCNNVFKKQNLMVFGSNKTAINPVVGMRDYGPLRKAQNSGEKRILFIYQNRNDANTLYRYLKNGRKHFPGLLSYVGIPVALAGPPEKGLPYQNISTLPNELGEFLEKYYPKNLYRDTLAIVIGPFRKYESDEVESDGYYHTKKILLDKGISSQFINATKLNSGGVHYALPNIAIAILAKFGGVPWKLSRKKTNELIVGFNTKVAGKDRYLGSVVFFDNEGRLGGVEGLPVNGENEIVNSLKDAITKYIKQYSKLERLVIHYYKPPRKKEIKNIEKLLENMDLSVPFAIVEINDNKSKLDICFDVDFDMGMPESGVFVKTGYDEYLLFNNNRYKKIPAQKIDDELPITLRLRHVNTSGFSTSELIAQVYEFSRLNWKSLKQRSVPVTTTYSKFIAEFSSQFGGEIPENEVTNSIPWFI